MLPPTDPASLIASVYDHVARGSVDNAVFACLRLARAVGDTFGAVMFVREMGGNKHELGREVQPLPEEVLKFVWEQTAEEWMDERLYGPKGAGNSPLVTSGVGDLMSEITDFAESIRTLVPPPGMGEFDTAAFAESTMAQVAKLQLRIRQNRAIIERIRSRCLAYASRIEAQIRAQEGATSFIHDIQNQVDNYFAARSPDVYAKLAKACELAGSVDAEDHSLLLTSIRRALKAAADHFYPAPSEDVTCVDGKTRALGPDAYLNRLQECCAQLKSSSSARLLSSELDYLAAIVRRLNDVASKGVHADVTRTECRQGLLTLYTFLSNLISALE